MSKLGRFLRTTFLGGFIIILPVVLTLFLLRWMVGLVAQLIEPLTRIITEHARLGHVLAMSTALILVVVVCFLMGLVVKTRMGSGLLRLIEKKILKVAPGYNFFKETIGQLLGQKNRPFSRVVLVRMFGSETMGIGFLTNEHCDSGLMTVFVPSGLNPTSGLLLHVPKEECRFIDVSVETAMRSIIGCGAGASALLDHITKKTGLEPDYER